MVPIKNNIVVSVDVSQKEQSMIGGSMVMTGKNYNENFRERNPVIALVVHGTEEIKTGSWIVCNYNYFEWGSPLAVTDDVFSIPVNEEIFALVNEDGTLTPIRGNIIVERVTKESKIDIPEDLKKPHINRGIVSTRTSEWEAGKFIFWLKYSDYEIVYTWKGEERRAIKIHESEIVGYFDTD
jgi:hypothetical protein